MTTKPKNLDRYLTSRYYNPRRPGSYGSANRLYKIIKAEGRFDIKLDDIRSWLRKQDVYTLYKPTRGKFPRRRVLVSTVDKIWDSDLIDYSSSKYIKYNDNTRYILVCVDILSRQAFAKPLRNKSSAEVARRLREIFDEEQRKPQTLRTDAGREYTGQAMKTLLTQYKVNHHISRNEVKANYAESFIRYFREKINKHMIHTKKPDYVKVLPDLLHGYNETPHTATGEAPNDVDKDNQEEIFEELYLKPTMYKSLLQKVQKKRKKKEAAKLKIGDFVRLSHLKRAFQKNHDEKWSVEVFTISDVDDSRFPPLYKLKDLLGEEIDGTAYSYELQKIEYDPDKAFEIDRILKTRKNPKTGLVEKLTSFRGWPSKFNRWLPAGRIKATGAPEIDSK